MLAAQRQLVRSAEGDPAGLGPQPQRPVGVDPGRELAPVGRELAAALAREPGTPRPAAQPAAVQLGERAVVVCVEERDVVRRLVLEHAQLGVGVVAIRAVPVDVVLAEVEQHGDTRAEGRDVFELEARQLGDDERVAGRLAGHGGKGVADIAAHRHGHARVAHDGADELGGRGLAVGPRDPDDRVGQKAEGELHLAPHRYAMRDRLAHDRALVWHARALDQQVGEGRQHGRLAEQHLYAGGGQLREALPAWRTPLVEPDHTCRRQHPAGQQGRRQPAAAQAEHGEAAHV